MKNKGKVKKTIIISASVAVAAALCAGSLIFLAPRLSKPVPVYDFSDISADYYDEALNFDGTVSAGSVQSVYLGNTKKVKAICVSEGDTVKAGDTLMTFDTTLSQIAVERARLNVEKLRLKVKEAEKSLAEISKLTPFVPVPAPEKNVHILKDEYEIIVPDGADGAGEDSPLICLLSESAEADNTVFEALREKCAEACGEAPENINECCVVFTSRAGDTSDGERTVWQGVRIMYGEEISFAFFNASGISDPFDGGNSDDTDDGSDGKAGHTAEEIKKMKAEATQQLKNAKKDAEMAAAEYKIMRAEKESDRVTAELDGTVTSVLDPETAAGSDSPIIKVSGSGGCYITCTIDEWSREKLSVGAEVTVSSWITDTVIDGTVQSIGDTPVEASNGSGGKIYGDVYSYGYSNESNITYYPFTVLVEDTKLLSAGEYVSIEYRPGADGGSSLYIMNMFIRKDTGGGTYVYAETDGGTLEKRHIKVGKTVWEEYTEVISGLNGDEKLAFPYGSSVREGAHTKDGDPSELYDYDY